MPTNNNPNRTHPNIDTRRLDDQQSGQPLMPDRNRSRKGDDIGDDDIFDRDNQGSKPAQQPRQQQPTVGRRGQRGEQDNNNQPREL